MQPTGTRAPSSPRAMRALVLDLTSIAAQGRLTTRLRAQIALALSARDPCLVRRRAAFERAVTLGIAPAELALNAAGRSTDPCVAAALAFARHVATSRGDLVERDFRAPRRAGFDDADLAQIVACVALDLLRHSAE